MIGFSLISRTFFYPEDGGDKESCEEHPVFLLHSPFKDTPISFDLHTKGASYCITEAYR